MIYVIYIMKHKVKHQVNKKSRFKNEKYNVDISLMDQKYLKKLEKMI